MTKATFKELKKEFKEKQSTFTEEEIVELAAYGYGSIKLDAINLGVGADEN